MLRRGSIVVAGALLAVALLTVAAFALPVATPAAAVASGCGIDEHANVLAPAEIRCAARAAGWRGKQVAIAAAIATAESGGRVDAVSRDGRRRGLFQIDRRSVPHSRACAFNALCNARAAHLLFAYTGFHAWSAYSVQSGGTYPYCRYLPAATRQRTKRCG